jgi:hypothetical protein
MSTIAIKRMVVLGICFCCLTCGVFIGCNRNPPYGKQSENWSLIHAGMTKKEVEDLLGKAPKEFTENDCLYLWYPSGLSEKDLRQPGLQVVAYVVGITNGVVENYYMPQQ